MTDFSTHDHSPLRPQRPVGIIGYGAYVPRYRLPAAEVARVWAGGKAGGLPVKEKAVAGLDEDVITMSIEAARNRTPAPSSLPARWSPKPSAPPRPQIRPTGNSPARPAPRRWWHAWDWW